MTKDADHELISRLRLEFDLSVERVTDDQVMRLADESFVGAAVRLRLAISRLVRSIVSLWNDRKKDA